MPEVSEISKRELLDKTGISYGQLYRWKRERLIPEEWFVKRSAITGQETYFPRLQILDRIEAILDLKEDHSLEEIREMLASEHSRLIGREKVKELGIVPVKLLDRAPALKKKKEFKRSELAFLTMLDEALSKRRLTNKEYDDLIGRSLPLIEENESANMVVFLLKATGKFYVSLARENNQPIFDSGIEVMKSASLADLVAKLKIGRFETDDDSVDENNSPSPSSSTNGNPKIVNIRL